MISDVTLRSSRTSRSAGSNSSRFSRSFHAGMTTASSGFDLALTRTPDIVAGPKATSGERRRAREPRGGAQRGGAHSELERRQRAGDAAAPAWKVRVEVGDAAQI